jgi:hypothetical protein
MVQERYYIKNNLKAIGECVKRERYCGQQFLVSRIIDWERSKICSYSTVERLRGHDYNNSATCRKRFENYSTVLQKGF